MMMPLESGVTRILVNSLPKSGTHLLVRAVEQLGAASYEHARSLLRIVLDRTPFGPPPFLARRSASRKAGRYGRASSGSPEAVPIGVFAPVYIKAQVVRGWLARIPPGQFLIGHLPFSQSMDQVLHDLGWRTVCIIRDPRAVVSSYIHYVLEMARRKHFLRADYLGMSRRQRIDFTLDGGLAPLAKVRVCGLMQAYASVLGWRASERALILRFEDLIGEPGGGSTERQWEAMRRLATHLGLGLDGLDRSRVSSIFDPGAPTFRVGTIDSWRSDLEAQEIERIQEKLAPLLQELGYLPSPEG